jgi:sugar O-acyltransferase (sialic acid O-acetyltransferase NeuD family)
MSKSPSGRPLFLMGTSGHAREILSIACHDVGYRVLGCVGPKNEKDLDRLPVPYLGDDAWVAVAPRDASFVIGIGDGRIRERVDRAVALTHKLAATLVHPVASVGSRVQLGQGAVVWPGAVLTTDISIGRHAHVNTRVAVGHDALVDDFATLLPGCTVGGHAWIGRCATIGAGATVLNDIKIGSGAFVGAGAVVVRDVPDDTVVVGVPARPMSPPIV